MNDALQVRTVPIQTTGYYCVQPPHQPIDAETVVVFALHGFGQKCRGFMRHFAPLAERNMLVVAPQGPHQFYMELEPKKVGFNWLTIFEKENSIRDFVGFMLRLLEEMEGVHGVSRENLVVLGFSQGVSMAYRLAASGAVNVRGLVACCSDLPPDVAEKLPNLAPFPVLLAHADDDPIVPVAKAEAAEEVLRANAYPVDVLRYTGGHTLTEASIAAMGDWIAGLPR